ncbi:MAG: hypothetical protein [Olavius algarvensis Gamma 1 endosymbiont]|nr:MAG: hypothetical protein [Olavius algarvensis Gamma 1 endosymbiont]
MASNVQDRSKPGTRPLTRLTMAAAAMGLFLAGYYWGNQYRRGDSTPLAIAGVLIRPAYPLPEFALRDGTDRPFTTKDFAGRWTLLSFGDPNQASGRRVVTRMIEVHNRLAGDPDLQEKLLLALVTPRRDPASDLRRWSPALTFLSGETEEIQGLRAALGMPARETTATADQTPPCYLIGPAGRLLALFPDAQTPAAIASDLVAIAAHADSPSPTDDG